ncbi:hypothetical protein ABZZ17_11040 [Streptomyces sp. NPDC006512]|uniref:hypothetical protein n=1 Tax=Streptomyces sp. NPDC006512 TaxID=3154307 RepID=UPI0033A0E495
MGQKAVHEAGAEQPDGVKKLDLSVAQIAGTSLATVGAALLASQLGVYGTIVGAGVVSVVATAGGPVIQHVFRRTGDQLRETARPKARQVPLPGGREAQTTASGAAAPDGEFGEATVHGTRVRGWKRTAAASAAAFAIAIGGLGTYEAVAGTSVSKGGDTLWSAGTRKAADHRPAPPGNAPGRGEEDGGGGKGGRTPGSGSSPNPSHPHGEGSRTPDPGTSPSANPSPPATPSPPVTPSGKPSPPATPSAPTPGAGQGGDAGTGTGTGTGGTGTGQGTGGQERGGGS